MFPSSVVCWDAMSSSIESCTSVCGALLEFLLNFVGCVVALSDDMINADKMPPPLCAELSLSVLVDVLFFIGENVSCPNESCSESQSNHSKSPLSRPVRDRVCA